MICTLLSNIGYLFNWKIEINNESKLLFESCVLCRLQSIFLIYFLTTRECLLTCLAIIVLLSVLKKDDLLESKIFERCIYIFCYGVTFISNLVCFILGGYGEQELICLTNNWGFGNIYGIIHFTFLFLILIINSSLVIYIYYRIYCKTPKHQKPKKEWYEDENDGLKIQGDENFGKIAWYPIGQAVCIITAIVYRTGGLLNAFDSNILWAQITAIANSLASMIYALIFIITNKERFIKTRKGTIYHPINYE